MIHLNKCEICGSIDLSCFLECRDHFLTKENFKLYKCNECCFVFLNPQPEKEKLELYYDSPDYISHSGTGKGIINKIYKRVKKITLQKKLKIVSRHSSGKKILDIGCGSGELMNIFNENNWQTMGVEPNERVRNYAIKEYGLKIVDEKEIEKIQDRSFDVISLWHVLEHVPELQKRMNELKRIIKANGTLFIAVPHCNSYDAVYYKEYWAAYDVPRHLWHFTPSTLEVLCNKYGFSVVNIIPMKFDSYYVSLLSEKYIHGKQKLFKGLWKGYVSNRKAIKQKYPYSSQIYVFRRNSEL